MPRIVKGKASDLLEEVGTTESVLLVRSNATEGEITDQVAILGATEALGTKSQAFLVYGIAGTESYSFFDLNNLPDSYVVSIVVSSGETVHSNNRWEGKNGNSPQPLDGA